MATFFIEVRQAQERKDGTTNVKIRVTHQRQVQRVATPFYVTRADLTRAWKLKNQAVTDACEDMIHDWKKKLLALGASVDAMNVRELCAYMTRGERPQHIPFFAEAEEYAASISVEATRRRYANAISSMRKHFGGGLQFSELRRKAVQQWIDTLTPACARSYVGCLRRIMRHAARKYNDEDTGAEPVQISFFSLLELPAYRCQRKRAIPVEAIRIMAQLPDRVTKKGTPRINSSYNFARDVFLLSFGLIGCNGVDLLTMSDYDGKAVTYQRSKTKRWRADHAEIRIEIQPFVRPLFNKFRERSKTAGRVFRFWRMTENPTNFDSRINRGLKMLAKDIARTYARIYKCKEAEAARRLNIEDLEFYAARHSWATIARNDLGIDKYTVHEALNHVDAATADTDVYIKKDFSAINEANRRVLEYVFGENGLKSV